MLVYIKRSFHFNDKKCNEFSINNWFNISKWSSINDVTNIGWEGINEFVMTVLKLYYKKRDDGFTKLSTFA